MIFVFGSNLAGIHGAGAARHAWKHEGAVLHKGIGPHGNSYAIPTKDYQIKTLPLNLVALHIAGFIDYAKKHPELEFKVTRIGCGLAGYANNQIAPLFKDAPSNCYFDIAWQPWLSKTARFWVS